MFYGGITSLDRNGLRKQLAEAEAKRKDRGDRREIKEDRIFRHADVIPSPDKLRGLLRKERLTLEGDTALVLGCG